MSKKASKRAKRRQAQGYSLSDARRDHLAALERRGRVYTTPIELERQAVREPFYLPELGLKRDPYVERVPPNQGGPIIRTRQR